MQKEKLFAKVQEKYRKDVERGFWRVSSKVGHYCSNIATLGSRHDEKVMKAVLILYNMIVEGRGWNSVEVERDASRIRFGEEATAIWANLRQVRCSGVQPCNGSLVALCAAKEYMHDRI